MNNLAKPKKINRSALKKKADTWFSKYIRQRGHCQAGGKDWVSCGGVLQTCHIIGRTNMRLRYDEKNVLCMCAGHHSYYTNHPLDWAAFIEAFYPINYVYVVKHKNEKVKVEYTEVIEKYKQYEE